jgi:hypothetical protein
LTFFYAIGGLASPPASENSSPIVLQGLCGASDKGNYSPCRYVNPRDLHDTQNFSGDEFECPKLVPRSRKLSLPSSMSGSSEEGEESDPTNSRVSNEIPADLLESREGGEPLINSGSKSPPSHSSDVGREDDPSMLIDLAEQLPESSDEEEEDDAVVQKSKGPPFDPSDPSDSSDDEFEAQPIVVDSKEMLAASSDIEDGMTVVDDSNEALADSSDDRKAGQAISEDEVGTMDVAEPPLAVEESLAVGDEDQEMEQVDGVDVKSSEELSDKMSVDGGAERLDISGDAREGAMSESDGEPSNSDSSVQPAALFEPRRSSRISPQKKMPILRSAVRSKVSGGKKKPAPKKNSIFPLVRVQFY